LKKNLKKGEYVSLIANGEPAFCVALEDGNLGIKVSDIPSKKLSLVVKSKVGKKLHFLQKMKAN